MLSALEIATRETYKTLGLQFTDRQWDVIGPDEQQHWRDAITKGIETYQLGVEAGRKSLDEL